MTDFSTRFLCGNPLRLYGTVDSTNPIALAWAREGAPHGACVVAKAQKAGRGRQGRSFFSPEGGLYMSVVLDAPPEKIGQITTLAAVAVCRAVQDTCGMELNIKWVNDCLKEGRKVCGILAEGLLQQSPPKSVVGIGINLGPAAFNEDLSRKAGALFDGPPPLPPLELAEAVLARLLDAYPLMPAHMEEYRARCITLKKQVRFQYQGEERTGLALQVEDSGALVVDMKAAPNHPPARLTLNAGEVSLRKEDGGYW